MAADEQRMAALPELLTLVGHWEWFLAGETSAEVLTEFIECGTEASGSGETAEAPHRVIALFDSSVVLLPVPATSRI